MRSVTEGEKDKDRGAERVCCDGERGLFTGEEYAGLRMKCKTMAWWPGAVLS